MKLLVDENLPHRLPELIADLYPGSIHVRQSGLKSSDDSEIWNYAKDNGFTIVSKDSDFYQRSILLGSPPKIIWLRIRNCTSAYVESLLRARYEAVSRFVEEERGTCLVLGQRLRRS